MGSTHERMRDGALRMRLIPVVIGLLGLPALAGGLVTANDALTAMDFPADRIEENHATPEIILEDDAIAPGGTTWIGVRFKIENGWHLYWNGRNDSGSPPSFAGELPAGYTLGEWLWPAPKRHIAPGDILDHIYEDWVLLMAPLKAPTTVDGGAKDGTKITIKIAADWLVCDSNMCVAESGNLETTLQVKSSSSKSKDAAPFEAARATHPKPWPTTSKEFTSSVVTKDARTIATIRAAGATTIEFYPAANCPEVDGLLKKGSVKGDALVLTLATSDDKSKSGVEGVVAVGRNGQPVSEFYTVKMPSPTAAK